MMMHQIHQLLISLFICLLLEVAKQSAVLDTGGTKQSAVVTVCLFVWDFSSHSRIFHKYGDVTIADEGLQMLTYPRHS